MSQFTGPSTPLDPIPTVVDRTLGQAGLRSYSGQAQPVVNALVQREQDLMNAIIAKAVSYGMSQRQAEDMLRDLGAHFAGQQTGQQTGQQGQTQQWGPFGTGSPAQGQQTASPGGQAYDQTIQGLHERVSHLENIARDAGYSR